MNVAIPAAGGPPTAVPTSASGQRVADTFDGQSVALLTQHGKEQVIAPLLQKDLVARLRSLCPACGAPGNGFTMAVGTLALFWYAQPQGETYALTLAFTAFVLFQFFNLFNARAEHGLSFNAHFFRNRWLWLSLAAVLALQALAVHWAPAQAIFRTTDLAAADWVLAAAVASSVLVLDEARKLASHARRQPSHSARRHP